MLRVCGLGFEVNLHEVVVGGVVAALVVVAAAVAARVGDAAGQVLRSVHGGRGFIGRDDGGGQAVGRVLDGALEVLS